MIGTEELRRTLREYALLEAAHTLVASGSRRDHLRGAARDAWLKQTQTQLGKLRWRLIAIAIVEAAKKDG